LSETVPDASADRPAAPSDEKNDAKGSALWREIKGLLWVLLAVLTFHSLIAKPFYIPSESMMPGDTLRMVNGALIINGRPVKRERQSPEMIPVDANSPCGSDRDPALYDFRVRGDDGKIYCRVPVVRETLPNGRSFETVELGRSAQDNFGPLRIPPGHVWLMGDNRDDSADSRVPEWQGGLGGAVPWENIGGRAEFITFSLNGMTEWWNPVTWFESLRSGRAGRSLRND
jgi:signal peptidase I